VLLLAGLTALLSMWMSNTATVALMVPLALGLLAAQPETEPPASEGTRAFILLALAYSASIGGMATLVGSPPNAIVAGYVSDQLDREITFLGWMQLGVPIVVVFLVVAWLLITRVLFRSGLAEIPGGREMIAGQLRELGPVSTGERRVLAVFAGAAFLWIVPGLLTRIGPVEAALPWLGDLDDTAIAIAAGIVLFLLPGNRRTDDGTASVSARTSRQFRPPPPATGYRIPFPCSSTKSTTGSSACTPGPTTTSSSPTTSASSSRGCTRSTGAVAPAPAPRPATSWWSRTSRWTWSATR